MKQNLKSTSTSALLFAAMLYFIAQPVSAGTVAYNYDPAGRLVGAVYANGRSHTYLYDNAGNLTQNVVTIPGTGDDSDNDGLLDSWEQQYFGNLSRNGSGDFDGDGFIDYNEFMAGTSPTDSSSLLRVLFPQIAGNSTTVQWSAVPGKTYRVQFKTDLNAAGWSDLPGDVTAAGSTASKVDNTSQIRKYYRVVLIP